MQTSRRRFIGLAGSFACGMAVPLGAVASGTAQAATPARAAAHTVTFDKYSLLVDGQRTVVWSGEFHPFRLPSPGLWLDIFQKMRACGYNTVSMYFAWNFHSPAPGVYDFSGVRDLDRVLDAAQRAGIWVIARSGPYINGEVDAGGFPGWLTTIAGRARTDNAEYLGYVDQWQSRVNKIIARHQHTDGSGTVIMYQIENEYAAYVGKPTGINYLAHLYAKARADGVNVPICHNDKGRHGYWTPGSFPTGDNNYLYAFDGYPSAHGTPPDWGYFGSGGATGGSTASPDTPGYTAEFGGGWFDPWGGAPWGGAGYSYERDYDGPGYEKQFYLTNVANGIKIQNIYMTFGGTSWGWLPAPVVYTSYDYGAAFDEARQLTDKVLPMKQMGWFLQSVRDICKVDAAGTVPASDPGVKVYHLTNPDTGTHFYLPRYDHTIDIGFTLPIATAAGSYTVPQSGSITLHGRDAKALVADYRMDSQHLIYTTSQLMTHAPIGDADVVVLSGAAGDGGETVLRYAARPTVTGKDATVTFDAATGDLRLNYTHSGLTEVRVSGQGRELLLVIVDDAAARYLWRDETSDGPVLAYGPELMREARTRHGQLYLSGDTSGPTALTVWAPRRAHVVHWNGRGVPMRAGGGAMVSRHPLPGAATVTLPELTTWRYATGNPESAAGFDDAHWTRADKTTSNSTTAVPAGAPVLFADDYGCHYGDVWYRGSWTGAAGADTVQFDYQTGTVGMLQAWLDGAPLGTHRMPVPAKDESTHGTWRATASFPLPARAADAGEHVLAVLVRPMAHEEDGGVNDAYKSARGIIGVTLPGADITWRIRGAGRPDRVRGHMNNGGLYGERHGWHLPGRVRGGSWSTVALPHTDTRQGVAWYRTEFHLHVPHWVDASLGLTITDDAARPYRALIFVNGWNMGQYVNDVGPQHTFVLPNGVLDPRGHNTLAVAVTSDGSAPAGLGTVTLTDLGTVAGGVPLPAA